MDFIYNPGTQQKGEAFFSAWIIPHPLVWDTAMHKNVIPCVLAHLSFFNRNALHVSEDRHEAQGNKVQQTWAVIFS